MRLERVLAVRNAKTLYRDFDRCVKVFNEEYSKADILSEALNQARMEETGLRVPRVLEIVQIDGKWAIVSEYIKGKTLSQLLREVPRKREAYRKLFLELQIQTQCAGHPMLPDLKAKLYRQIDEAMPEGRQALHQRLAALPTGEKVCHFDFVPSNILIAKDGTPYILDWAHAALGCAEADAASTFLRLCLQENEEGANDFLAAYCSKARVAPERVRPWVPVVAGALLAGANARERAFLQAQVASIDRQ